MKPPFSNCARNEQLLLLSQCLQMLSSADPSKCICRFENVKSNEIHRQIYTLNHRRIASRNKVSFGLVINYASMHFLDFALRETQEPSFPPIVLSN